MISNEPILITLLVEHHTHTHTHTRMHLKKVLINETGRALWTERIYDYPIPGSAQG